MAATDNPAPVRLPDFPKALTSLIDESFLGAERIDSTDLIHGAYLHHFKATGGGARSKLAFRCASNLGVEYHDATCLAAAVECLHNASLIQDDLQDGSHYRRGQASVFAEFGRDVALGLTNRLITAAFSCLSRIENSSALPLLIRKTHEAVAETIAGQTRELAGTKESLSLGSRISAARQKSGPLFALSLEFPLIMAGEEKSLVSAHEAACLFGLGYQILDDLKDQKADSQNDAMGSIVLAMKAERSDPSIEQAAVQLARSYLNDAISNAGKLPRGAREPMTEMIENLLLQIDAFTA